MTEKNKIRLLIADDFEIIRHTIARVVSLDGDIEVIGEANNGLEAVEKTCQLHPDVVLLDMRMPIMGGIAALKEIMRRCPTPVLMVSAFAKEGAEDTLEALEAGAVDFVPKLDAHGSMDIGLFKQTLLEKIRAASQVRPQILTRPSPALPKPLLAATRPPKPKQTHNAIDIVLIGASTGGPNALQTVMADMPGDLPVGILIVQHMPPAFTGQLAARLNKISQMEVREARDGDSIKAGLALIAPGDRHLLIRQIGAVSLAEEPATSLHRPSVDILMHSGAQTYGRHALGVILTGMGDDGAVGVAALKDCGGTIIAQDEASSIVYGMPRAVAHLADSICPLPEVAAAIRSYI
jgi:two-component system, chemotaxis family, protein-glutamate methylesterase/glutaminase